MPHIVVLGAGVVGLSAALAIQEGAAEAGHDRRVTVLARDFPGPFETIDPTAQINYASPWGGAHNRLVPPTSVAEEDEHRMSIATSERMGALLHQSGPGVTGVTFMRGVEYLEDPGPQYLAITEEKARSELGMRGFRLLRPEELPDDKVAWGCEYETWCVNPMVYCSFLLRRFVFAGGRVVKKEVRDPAEIFSIGGELGPVDVVVNASGSGFGDPNVFPTRGQTCLVADKKCSATITRQNADGSWSFCIPRGFDGGTIIGGTKEPDDWNPNPVPETRDRLLRNFAAGIPGALGDANVAGLRVIHDIVGRRPTRRGGMRLEKETIAGNKCVIHAYGLGGRGYELSWGVADRVIKLLSEHLGAHGNSKL